jgi:hypothetical protein
MSGTLQPLDQKFAIVDNQGVPTDYFIRWAQQKQIDIGDSITLTDLEDYLTEHMLIEGSGIQFSPDGNIKNHVTIAADVQEILDQVTATRGAVLYRGLLGWSALLPGAAGQFLKTNGPGADPTWAVAGASGATPLEITPVKPLAANFTLDNGGAGGTLADKTYGLHVNRPVAGGAQISVARSNTAAPAAAFTLTARLTPTYALFQTGYSACIILRNSTNGRLIIFGDYQGGTNILAQGWTSYAAFSSNIIGPAQAVGARFPWRRVVLAAGSLDFQCSPDGDVWTSVGTQTVAAFLTAAGGGTLDQLGFGGYATQGTLCQSWTVV